MVHTVLLETIISPVRMQAQELAPDLVGRMVALRHLLIRVLVATMGIAVDQPTSGMTTTPVTMIMAAVLIMEAAQTMVAALVATTEVAMEVATEAETNLAPCT